ncbi:DUT nucleotidohydrolase, partial [Baryphthengus martii]|nr:DUT nucleotidohydrolase [Baryphthengus martii]
RGSFGVDVATAIEVTLTNKEVSLIPTNVNGPMFSTTSGLGGLLLGRSSTGKQGVIVLPGVIDADFTGQVQIMAYSLQPPVTIPKGSKIAQILPYENLATHRNYHNKQEQKSLVRGEKGFGSSGYNIFFTLDMTARPFQNVTIARGTEKFSLQPMLDMGADITIIN